MGYLLTTQRQYQELGATGAVAATAEPVVGARKNANWWSTHAANAIKLSPLTNGMVFKGAGTGSSMTAYTSQIWGIAEKGDMELLLEIAWTLGTQTDSDGLKLADKAAITANTGLAAQATATNGTAGTNNYVALVTLDGIGYEQIAEVVTVKTGANEATKTYVRTY